MTVYEGSCHCGEVTWTADIPEEKHVLCHCNACQKIGGGDYTLNQIIPKDNFKLTKGDLKVYTYTGFSGKNTDCFFCGTCTASPYHHQHIQGEDKIVIRTGLLKGSSSWGKPIAEIYGKDKASWQPQVADSIFETVPGK